LLEFTEEKNKFKTITGGPTFNRKQKGWKDKENESRVFST